MYNFKTTHMDKILETIYAHCRKPSRRIDVANEVIADIKERKEMGKKKYGEYLNTHNGRSALQDAYEEALDLAQYLKQKILEDES